MKSIKAIFRRGQTSTKLDGQIHTPEDLSRSSSVTNLNLVDQNSPKSKTGTAKPRKSSSRDRLDKIVSGTGTTDRKNDRKGINKNNNKFEPGDQSLSLDSLQEIESLKSQLHLMATEKSSLALKLGEQKGQIHTLQHQIENLKMYQEQSSLQLEQLTEENTALRNRLRDVAHSPLSDNEKQQLLYESHRHHNSAPASIATNPMEDGTCGDVTACPTPDWDKHSSSNVSDVSVACLQDKINQMQETHYSTNEELQATLQELTDLQRQLTELQQENERLGEEKNLMFDSLCRQTERLKDTRQEVESLKTFLYREKNETGMESAQEREEKLVDLLKSAQDDHESLISKHEQLSGELQELREANDALHEQLKLVNDRNGTLESTLDAKQAEHKLLDQELMQARDQCNGKQIEVNRLKDLLENARTKINELEQDRAMSDKSELDELLDNARKEKDALESEVAHLKEQLARSKNEIEKLKEQISILQEECKVTRNNARTIQSDLEYKYDKLASEKAAITEQLHKFQDIINELQVQAQCQEEDKRNLSDVLAETQRNLSESERKIAMLENDLADVKKLRKEENEEWEKFQNDLLTSVRVANDFKTEAQQDLQKMIMENKEHRDKVRQLEAQLDKLKGGPEMPEERRNSQPFQKQNAPKRIFGSLPNLLETCSDKEQGGKGSKRPKWMRHQKKLSQGEEKILDSLHEMYNEIDPEKPDSMLTSEQAVVKKLKALYENDSTAYKPVAPRRKHELAISKPLLKSVYSNPKLESIAKDPKLKNLETDRFSWMGHKRFSDDQIEIKGAEDTKKGHSFVSYLQVSPGASPRQSSNEHRASSMDNAKQFPLRRYSSKEDLTGITDLESFKHSSNSSPGIRSSLKSIQSDTSSNISQKKRVSFDEKRNSCVVIKEFLSFGSLEDIYSKIDPKIPEEQLSKEQRFAIRLKTSMENLDRKSELRKRPTFKKNKVTISSPLKESVLRNTKLLSIIKDPIVRTAGEDVEQETVELRKVHRMKKYLADINRVLRNPSKTFKKDPRLSRSLEDFRGFSYTFKRISSSMENLPSERGTEPKIEIKVVTKILPAKSYAASFNVSSSSSSVDNSVENLVEKSGETPVIFIEHFESESRPTGSKEIKTATVDDEGVQIKDISEDSRTSADDEYTGRVSFPEEEGEVCRMKLLSINSVEMEEEDDVLARYRKISEYREEDSDKESYQERTREEDTQSFYSVELKTTEDPTEKEENWLTRCLDQSCDIEDRKENRKMRVIYKNVVQEIKRKYSQDQHSSSESSEDEGVHIFNPKEGKIEIRRLSDDEKSEANFFDRFFRTKRSFLQENTDKTNQKEENLEDDLPNRSLEKLNPTEEEQEYIRLVRKIHKEEFEDIDRLGYIDVESDNFKKPLCRQNAFEHEYVDNNESEAFVCRVDTSIPSVNIEKQKTDVSSSESSYSNYYLKYLTEFFLEKEIEHYFNSWDNATSRESIDLSKNDQKLLSTVKKPISDENMDDLAFIEPSKEEYLTNNESKAFKSSELCSQEITIPSVCSENKKSEASSTESSSYSSTYLKYLTEVFLNKEIDHYFHSWEDATSKKFNYLSIYEQKLMSNVKKRQSRPLSDVNLEDLAFIESMKDKYLNNDKTALQSSGVYGGENRSPSVDCEKQKSDASITESSSYSKYYLKYSTQYFLEEEKEHYDHSLEQNLISRLNKRKIRPISGVNMESMKHKYLINDHKTPQSSVSFIKENTIPSVCIQKQESNTTSDKYSNCLKYLTEYFLKREIDDSVHFWDSKTNYNDYYLRCMTSQFLTREINNNTSFEWIFSKKTQSSDTEIRPHPHVKDNDNEVSSISRQNPEKFSASGKLKEVQSCGKSDQEFPATKLHYLGRSGSLGENSQLLAKETLFQEEFTSNTEIILKSSTNKPTRNSSESSSWLYYQPVYANTQELNLNQPKVLQVTSRKPKPLPRKSSKDSRTNSTTMSNADSVARPPDNFTIVKVKNEPHKELLPNSCKVMDECNDAVETLTKSGNILQDRPTSSEKCSDESIAKSMNTIGSSNVMVRKTKKFIKEGDLVEEFDEANGVYNVRFDSVLDNDKFDTKSQIIPDALIDFADSESKITLFDVENTGLNDFQESCSRPQTSRQRPTPFRLSYYGENSEEGIDGLKEAAPRTSKENVTRLKQKFENISTENDEPERNSVVMKEFKDAQKANLTKLLNEKAAYDLVFKTESKYWFDNTSESDRQDSTIQTSAPSFESSPSQKPLNITILDPIESKTNANYQHLFENDPLHRALQKPFVGNVKLSELNLKTSIPCVDFTTLNSPMVERESNASLYNFGLGSEASSIADGATCATKEE